MKKMPISTRKEPTAGQRIINYLIMYAVAMILSAGFVYIFDFFTKPLRRSKDRNDIENDMAAKQKAREDRDDIWEENENDPMYQFHLRFIEEPEQFKADPDNEIFKDWYDAWKAGEILDSFLQWTPPVYERPELSMMGEEVFCVSFLKYMQIQYNLHRKASLYKKGQFLYTIDKYFPEFTPTMKGLKEDIAVYYSMIKADDSVGELKDELKKFGLSADLADYLIEKDLSPNKMKEQAKKLKDLSEQDIETDTCIFLLEHERDLPAECIQEFLGLTKKIGSCPEAALALTKGEVTVEELEELWNDLEFSKKSCDIMEWTDLYPMLLEDGLRKYRNNKRAKKFLV